MAQNCGQRTSTFEQRGGGRSYSKEGGCALPRAAFHRGRDSGWAGRKYFHRQLRNPYWNASIFWEICAENFLLPGEQKGAGEVRRRCGGVAIDEGREPAERGSLALSTRLVTSVYKILPFEAVPCRRTTSSLEISFFQPAVPHLRTLLAYRSKSLFPPPPLRQPIPFYRSPFVSSLRIPRCSSFRGVGDPRCSFRPTPATRSYTPGVWRHVISTC